jgi:hypothetical protein
MKLQVLHYLQIWFSAEWDSCVGTSVVCIATRSETPTRNAGYRTVGQQWILNWKDVKWIGKDPISGYYPASAWRDWGITKNISVRVVGIPIKIQTHNVSSAKSQHSQLDKIGRWNETTPFHVSCFSENLVGPGIKLRTSGSVARNSVH